MVYELYDLTDEEIATVENTQSYFTENGKIEKAMLCESPFTDLND